MPHLVLIASVVALIGLFWNEWDYQTHIYASQRPNIHTVLSNILLLAGGLYLILYLINQLLY